MLAAEQIASFERDGFLNSGPVLEESEINDIADGLSDIIDIGPDGFAEGQPQPVSYRDLRGGDEASGNPVWQIVNIWEASPAFERLIYNPYVVQAISELTSQRNLQVWHDQIQVQTGRIGRCHHLASGCPPVADHQTHDARVGLDSHG